MLGLDKLRRQWNLYHPATDRSSFADRVETQSEHGLEIGVAVLDSKESQDYFGVPMARRGVQPIWLRVVNQSGSPYRLHIVGVDPDYFSPLEAAAINHFSTGKRLLGFGVLVWLLLPLLLLVPIRLLAVRRANQKMDRLFQDGAFRLRPIAPGSSSEGFIFTPLDVGKKVIRIRLCGPDETREFVFAVSIPGLDVDHARGATTPVHLTEERVECGASELVARLESAPRSTTNASGKREGDPVNLVVIGEFETVLAAFASRWDETENISLKACWRTVQSFLMGREYRYSPVSPLHLYGRRQDFALQRVRESINERLHLRLWLTPWAFRGTPVWVGQISRDIGVRFTWRTWNLTTHRIDPDVDEARDYVVQDLLDIEHLEATIYVNGVGECSRAQPRRNLTGDPFFTDGKRAIVLVSQARTTPRILAWV